MLKVYPKQFTPEFRIVLHNDQVILHGTPEEAAGVNVRGSVILNCFEQMKVKSITLKFTGTTHVNWTEGSGTHQKRYKAEQVVIKKEWTFLTLKKKGNCLSQGNYKWDFEIPLPGNLPATVKHELGEISYGFKAYCNRPRFFSNLVNKKTLHIARHMLPSSLQLNQSVMISNIWADKIAYDISIPSKVYTANKSIPISFDLVPIAPHLKIKSVYCCLKEYVTCHTTNRHKTESKMINYVRDKHLVTDPENGKWNKVELLHIESNLINFDISGELFNVKHKLKFSVTLVNSDGHISELRAAIPLVIAPILPETNDLPSYEDTLRTAPYSVPMFAQSMPNLPQLFTSSESDLSIISTSSESSLTAEPLYWMGSEITQPPSYAFALQSPHTCRSTPSLPTYDSLYI